VLIEVRDTGPGLTLAEQTTIFRPDARTTTPSSDDGAGLGLAISADIVRTLGGTIGVRSNRDDGCTFWVELPNGVPADAVTLPSVAPDIERAVEPLRQRGPSMSALVVDDDPIGRRVTGRMLEDLGYDVTCAASVAEARAAVVNVAFGVIVLDWHLGDGTGTDVVTAVRASGASREAVVIGLTAGADVATHDRCLAAGMADCLVKPLPAVDLARALVRSVPGSRAVVEPDPVGSRLDALARLELEVPGLLARVATDYGREATRLLTRIDDAVAAGDASEVARAAHALRGSSATAGAARAAVLAEAIERAALHGGTEVHDGATHKLDALRDAVTDAAAMLHRLADGARVAQLGDDEDDSTWGTR
jgi:CheY-like chemotaxis protein